jgi:hypothetical protein
MGPAVGTQPPALPHTPNVSRRACPPAPAPGPHVCIPPGYIIGCDAGAIGNKSTHPTSPTSQPRVSRTPSRFVRVPVPPWGTWAGRWVSACRPAGTLDSTRRHCSPARRPAAAWAGARTRSRRRRPARHHTRRPNTLVHRALVRGPHTLHTHTHTRMSALDLTRTVSVSLPSVTAVRKERRGSSLFPRNAATGAAPSPSPTSALAKLRLRTRSAPYQRRAQSAPRQGQGQGQGWQPRATLLAKKP